MRFTEDEISKPIETLSPTWEHIEKSLKQLDGDSKSFFVLELKNSNYIQCAGQPERLTLEYRIFEDQGFKHFVLGKKKLKKPSRIVWTTIECKVGPIRIHQEEVMELKDALLIFKLFYDTGSIPTEFNKRNVTKYFY